MPKIKVLDSITYNQISAGEVIERPSSVVKELTENALDAGAETITIFISNDAKNITIIDDGVGMERQDARNCFYKHATSKLSGAKDLENMTTYGFRGEAIPSIASISMMTIRTKHASEEVGTEVVSKGGVIATVEDCSMEKGTEVIVENLFFNTPVREKFLKVPKSEEREITVMVEKLILSNPYVAFNYYLNGKKIYSVSGKNLENAVFEVYSGDYIENSHFINVVRNDISIKGYFSKIDFPKGNRTYQSTFVNGRYVKNETLSQCLNTAYRPFVMKKSFPFFVMHFDFLPQFVDVNVSPTKTDVRFQDTKLVFGTIFKAVTEFLKSETEPVEDCGISGEFPLGGKKEIQYIHTMTKEESEVCLNASFFDPPPPNAFELLRNYKEDRTIEYVKEEDADKIQKKFDVEFSFTPKEDLSYREVQMLSKQMFDSEEIADIKEEPLTEAEETDVIIEWQKELNRNLDKSDIRIIGQLFSTYIIVQSGDKMMIIDQHAGHEAMLYDKFRIIVSKKNVERQEMLVPHKLVLNPIEEDFIHVHHYSFMDLGFRIYPTDDEGVYEVWDIPTELIGMDIQGFFNDVFTEIEQFHDELPNFVRMNLIQKACKHAVKAGDVLSIEEIEALVVKLRDNINMKCPHGRPVVVTVPKKDIEKWFKRII
ncbi:MAG: DNA mismatch repair endonuclease MutL [Bacillota bacterium]